MLRDQTGVLTTPQSSKDYPAAMCRAVVRDDSGKRLVFLTNHFSLRPEQIADLYDQRWRELEAEFAVGVLPFGTYRDIFHSVLMFCNLAVLDSEQIVERSGFACEGTLADHQDEIAFAQDFVDGAVLHGDTCLRHFTQRFAKTR